MGSIVCFFEAANVEVVGACTIAELIAVVKFRNAAGKGPGGKRLGAWALRSLGRLRAFRTASSVALPCTSKRVPHAKFRGNPHSL